MSVPSALENEKYDVVIREPSLSGEFAKVGIPDRETAQSIYASPDTTARLAEIHPNLLGTAAELTNADHVIFVSREDVEPILKEIDTRETGDLNILHNGSYEHYGEAAEKFGQQFEGAAPMLTDLGCQGQTKIRPRGGAKVYQYGCA